MAGMPSKSEHSRGVSTLPIRAKSTQALWQNSESYAGAPSWHLSCLPSRRMNHDAILLGNCSNCVEGRHVCGAFAGGVEGSKVLVKTWSVLPQRPAAAP
jgi:hypothetical protein